MEVVFISPVLTIGEDEKVNNFFGSVEDELKKYILNVSTINSIDEIKRKKSNIKQDALIIFFNSLNETYDSEILDFIDYLSKKNIEIWPVAINKDSRIPIQNIKFIQSFDVYEQLRCRNLSDDYMNSVGLILARKIISRVKPNFYNEKNLLFVSHRRIDGEDIAAKLCDQLLIQSKTSINFRDITNIAVGEEAQEEIKLALYKSDILIFIHTEKAAKSDWITRELIYAVLNNIPILWIKVGNASELDLPIKPAENPHLIYNEEDFYNQKSLVKIVDDVLSKSFELIMVNSDSVYDYIERLEDLCKSKQFNLNEIDESKLIYRLNISRKGCTYPQRDIKHYIQYFGRRCNENDYKSIEEFLDKKTCDKDRLYDSAILLSDKNKIRLSKKDKYIVEENYDDFYDSCRNYLKQDKVSKDIEIVISGSFPECDEIYKQSLYDAVNILSKEILKSGVKLTFGSHPTFQNIIFEIGKKYRPSDYKNAVKMFISKYFKDKYNIEELNENAEVYEIEKVESNLLKSLTLLRENMINREEVKALICLGGIIRSENDSNKGVIEEIEIARENNIPVFLVGMVGGKSSQIAAKYLKNKNWAELNNAPIELNEELALSLDYRTVFKKLIDNIVSYGE
ncbi:TIR domain-containing protein [Intestinibacter bartlettii]|uniref:SLOG domain-containing protein n=1 Tax=Intestinibacter bartlettii TaxID=261299 RepID=UPI0039A13A6A